MTPKLKQFLLTLYPKYDNVLGPYKRKDGRQHLVLNDSTASRSDRRKTRTLSYPKALMECFLGKRLKKNQTVDHVDDDFTNNRRKNLQVLTRKQNAAKAPRTGASTHKHIVAYSRSSIGRQASSIRMSKLNESRKLN